MSETSSPNASASATQPSSPLPIFRDPRAWYGPQMQARGDWIGTLEAQDIAELDAAAGRVIDAGHDLVALTQDDFPLPRLAPRLRQLRQALLHGCGFGLLRGWPSAERSLLQSAVVFRGIGAHLGEAVSQNGKGHVLGHVTDLGLNYADANTRGYQTSAELRFHTDGGDIVGLLCVRPSRSGGLSRIASSTTVWNEMVSRRPDLARALTEPFAFTRWNEVRAGAKRYYTTPLFMASGGRMFASIVPSAIEKAQAFPDVPRISEAQREAVAMVETLAGDDAIRLDMDFRPGDIQFVCNHSILHSRTAYEDWPEPGRRRHLLRLWLSSDDGPPLPEGEMRIGQALTASGRPAGIRVPGVTLIAPLAPA